MREEGFMVVDKPPGLTSHDIVAIVRAVTGITKVGHTGTLDPFATGVLPLALGKATRLIQYLDEAEKVYDATILLGSTTDTADPTGVITAEMPVPDVSEADVRAVLQSFIGDRMQTPPRYSAVKVAGKALYDYARAGKEVTVAPRPIRVYNMELLTYDLPHLRVRIHCSRGTYARVLAEEIGQSLGTLGHLEALRRDRSGPFTLEKAITLSQLAQIVANNPAWDRVLRPGRGVERIPWLSRPEVLERLQPWIQAPVTRLTQLPQLSLNDVDARRYQQQGTVPPGLTAPLLLLHGGEVLGVYTGLALTKSASPDRRAADQELP